MMPLGGHAVVLCLLLLALVHRCILMDTSNNEVSFWQCSKEPVSQAHWNKRIDGAHHKMRAQFRRVGLSNTECVAFYQLSTFYQFWSESGIVLKFSGIDYVCIVIFTVVAFFYLISISNFLKNLLLWLFFMGSLFTLWSIDSFLLQYAFAAFKQVQFMALVLVNTVY